VPGASAEVDARAILKVLTDAGVEFVLIGGQAATAQGSTTVTIDIDVVYSRERANLERLAGVLRQLGATLRGADPGLPFRLDAETLHRGLNFTFQTRLGPLDCLGEASGDFTYHRLAANADVYEIAGVRVKVASLDDLIQMKRAAGRVKDRIEVENLSALREVRDDRRPSRRGPVRGKAKKRGPRGRPSRRQ
jgi:hypothetical protein